MKLLKKEIDVIERLEGNVQYISEKSVRIDYPNYDLTIRKIKKGYSLSLHEKGTCRVWVINYIGKDIKEGVQKIKDFWWRTRDQHR